MSHRLHVSALIVVFACVTAVGISPASATSASKAKSAKAKNACQTVAASDVQQVFGVPSVSGASAIVATPIKGTTYTTCDWKTVGSETVDGSLAAEGTSLVTLSLIRGPDMKTQFDQASSAAGTAVVPGFGKAAKYAPGLGLVVLVDATTILRVAATGVTPERAQAASEAVAKVGVLRATGAKKAAPSQPPSSTP